MLGRLRKLLDPDELEAALPAAVAALALDPAVPAASCAHRAEQRHEQEEKRKKRKRKPQAAEGVPGGRGRTARTGRTRSTLGWIPHPAAIPGTFPRARESPPTGRSARARKASAEQEGAPARRRHPRARDRDRPGPGRESREGQRDQPLQAAARAAADRRDRRHRRRHAGEPGRAALFLRKVKDAHWLWPILGNQPSLNETLNALDRENTPVAAATSEISRGRIETRTVRVLPAPGGTGFEDAAAGPAHRAVRHVQEEGQWHTRAESVLYLTSLPADETTPEDLLAHVRGHWQAEHTHWLRDVIWKEGKSLIQHGNGPQIWSALHQPRHHPIPHTRSNQLHPPRPAASPRTPAAHSRSSTPQPFHQAKQHTRL